MESQNNIKYFRSQDLIEKQLEAKHKYNKNWLNFKKIGKVIDETKFTLKLQQEKHEIQDLKYIKKTKIYIKNQYIFRCQVDQNGNQIIIQFDGEKMIGTPGNRIKNIKKPRRKLH